MASSGKYSARQTVEALYEYGVREVVVSPGSRNIPLILALEADTRLRKISVLDERVAAFAALGMAIEQQRPVACVCTSGSALLNFAPAISEAYYRCVPLIAISADRPIEWIDHDDSQTIRQYGVLDHIVKGSYNIADCPGEITAAYRGSVNRTLNDALATAISRRKGPVHINIEFDVPLGDLSDESSDFRRIQNHSGTETVEIPDVRYDRIMVVAGTHSPDKEYAVLLQKLWKECGIPVLCEAQSNINGINATLVMKGMRREEDKSRYIPELVITTGGSIVSAQLKNYLRKSEIKEHWYIGYSDRAIDCYRKLTRRFDCDETAFLRALYNKYKKVQPSEYSNAWLSLFKHSAEDMEKYITQAPWSYFKAMKIILDGENHSATNDYRLHISNGSAIRYVQLISVNYRQGVECNRGVSGIDGSTSTAIGAAMTGAKVLLLTGDMSAQYDMGALALREIPDSFRMVVFDNRGGGIFRVIKSTDGFKTDERERYLSANINLPLKALAAAFDFDYFEAGDEESLCEQYPLFLDSKHKAILHVKTDPEVNARVFRGF